jgi:hypothetical protein
VITSLFISGTWENESCSFNQGLKRSNQVLYLGRKPAHDLEISPGCCDNTSSVSSQSAFLSFLPYQLSLPCVVESTPLERLCGQGPQRRPTIISILSKGQHGGICLPALGRLRQEDNGFEARLLKWDLVSKQQNRISQRPFSTHTAPSDGWYIGPFSTGILKEVRKFEDEKAKKTKPYWEGKWVQNVLKKKSQLMKQEI